MTQWCLAAGPRCITTEFALQVFLDVRWSIVSASREVSGNTLMKECKMNRDIEGRKCSILGDENWRALPWSNFTKDSLHNLFDIGFALAACLEQADLISGNDAPGTYSNNLGQLSFSCDSVKNRLVDWYNAFFADRVPPQHLSGSDSNRDMHDRDHSADPPEFTDLWKATNMVYYWLFKMILNDIRPHASQQTAGIGDLPSVQHAASASENRLSHIVPASPPSGSSTEQSEDTNLTLATNIVSASSCLLASDTGWLGPQRLFFPLRRAMEYLAQANSPLCADARAAFMSLVKRLRG